MVMLLDFHLPVAAREEPEYATTAVEIPKEGICCILKKKKKRKYNELESKVRIDRNSLELHQGRF